MVQRAINSHSDPDVSAWADEGGPATIEAKDGKLLVSQTPHGQARVADLLNRLRLAIANRPPPADEMATVRQRLGAKVDLALEKVPLDEALGRLNEALGRD